MNTAITPTPTADTLSEAMEFDRVIHVDGQGNITEHADVHAPELMQYELEDGTWVEELSGDGWELMNGYSGQHGYSGPMMHASEFIGGRLASDILSGEAPGYYVAVAPSVVPLNGEDAEPDSWAVAFKADEAPAGYTVRVHCDGIWLSTERVEGNGPVESATAFSEAVEAATANWAESLSGITVDMLDESGTVVHSHTFA